LVTQTLAPGLTPNSRSYLNRWTSPDTIIPDPYNPLDYDRYSYVRNNPINYSDPTGHFSQKEIMEMYKVKTWEEVIKIFHDSGAWHWLSVLREAHLGDSVFWSYKDCTEEQLFNYKNSFEGGFWKDGNGRIQYGNKDATDIRHLRGTYGLEHGPEYRLDGGRFIARWDEGWKNYLNLRANDKHDDLSGINGVGTGADVISVTATGFAIAAKEGSKIYPGANTISTIFGVASGVNGAVINDPIGVALSVCGVVGGFVNPILGLVYGTASIFNDLVYIGP